MWIIGTITLNFSNISMNRHIPIGCTGIWLWSNWTTQKFKELLLDSFFFIFTLEQIKATCLVHATFLWNFHCQKSTCVTSFFKPVKGSLKNQFHMTTLSNCLISIKYFHQFWNIYGTNFHRRKIWILAIWCDKVELSSRVKFDQNTILKWQLEKLSNESEMLISFVKLWKIEQPKNLRNCYLKYKLKIFDQSCGDNSSFSSRSKIQ